MLFFQHSTFHDCLTDEVIFVCLGLTSWRQLPLGKENCMCCGAGCGLHSPVWDKVGGVVSALEQGGRQEPNDGERRL